MKSPRLTILLFLSHLLVASPLAHASKQEDLDKLRSRIDSLRQEVEKTSETRNEAADALRKSETAISTHNRHLSELSNQRHQTESELRVLQEKADQIQTHIHEQQRHLERLLQQQYVNGQPGYLQLLFSNRDPERVSRDLNYYSYIAHERADWVGNLRSDLAQLHVVEDQTTQKNQQIATLQTEAEKQRRNLEKEKLERKQILEKTAAQLAQQRNDLKRLQRDEARLTHLIERLAKMLAESQAKPKSKPNAPANRKEPTNTVTPDNRFDGKEFAGLKGRLAMPVSGQLTNQFGAIRPDTSLAWKGLFMRAVTGQSVKVIAAGQVVFSDWLRGFGNLIIIDHGQGYMSLYGNNETLYKQVGEKLRGGDTIATVGNSGGNETSGLYFEIRHEGKPVDPLHWVSVK